MIDTHPYVTSYLDRHGRRRWRFRRGKRTVALPGGPEHPQFAAAYAAALAGQETTRRDNVARLPSRMIPQSLRHAYLKLTSDTIDWKRLAPETQQTQHAIIERFLLERVTPDAPLTFGDVLVADMKRRHVKKILAERAATPHAAAHLLRMLRKLIGVALDEEWIDYDPTYRLRYRPAYGGWKAWPAQARDAFEARWPIGTIPRAAYALALYQGHRRADVAAVRWTDLEAAPDAARIYQSKTNKHLWMPMHPELARVLEATPRKGETVLITQYGRPYSKKALGMRMRDWCAAANVPAGYTLHGLRKSLGAMLAESGATTRQIMAILGHEAIEHAELYTREAEQRTLARDGMLRLIKK